MKITISVSDDILKLSEQLAKRLNVSKSKIFAMGLEHFKKKLGEDLDRDEIITKLNDFYADYQEDDSVIRTIAIRELKSNEW